MISRIAFKELQGQKKYFGLIALNVLLGLVGFCILGYFKTAVQNSVSATSKSYLGADIRISSRVALTDEELKVVTDSLKPGEKLASNLDVYTMVYADDQSRLIMLKVLDKGFPFYGEYQMDAPERIYKADDFKVIFENRDYAWASSDLLAQLDVKKDDVINVGSSKMKIIDLVKKDTGGEMGFSGLAPKMFLSRESFLATGLLAEKGSTVTYRHLIKINPEENVDVRVSQLQDLLPNPAIRVMTHEAASEQTARALVYLSDYLGLVSLTALFLSGLGMFFLWRNYLQRRLTDFAVFRCLGLTSKEVAKLVIIQSLIVTLVTSLVVVFVSYFLSVLVASFANSILPVELKFEFTWRFLAPTALLTLAVAFISQVLILFPMLTLYGRLKPNQLFSESALRSLSWKFKDLRLYIPLVMVFWIFAMIIAQSYRVGSLFFGLFIATIGVVAGLSYLLLSLIDKVSVRLKGIQAVSLKQITRQKTQSIVLFLTWGLGLSLMSFIFTLEVNLQKDFSGADKLKLPNLFLVDIQPDQLEGLSILVEKYGGRLHQTAPFIVSRLLNVNGESFEKKDVGDESLTREEQEEIRFRNRGMNISSRAELAPSERIVRGEWFKEKFDFERKELPLISVERDFARRFKWTIGDVLEFDIQGVPIAARISSFRQVKWNSFDPNFFVMFQPGVLDEAPQTYLSTIRGVSDDKLMTLQTEMVKVFPSISVIDVRTVSNQALLAIEKMSYAIKFMAFLSLIAGLGVFVAILLTQLRVRRKEVNMLKILGLTTTQVSAMLLKEQFAILTFIGIVGAVTGVSLAYLIQMFFFTEGFTIPFQSLVALVGGFLVFCLGVVYLGFREILKVRPQEILKSI